MQRIFRGLYLLVLFGAVTVSPTFSVAQMVGGTISGSVVDPSNAPLDQAKVVIRNEETATERNLTTAADGTFSAPSIAIGVYSVSVEKDGFAPLKRTGITVAVAQHVQLRLSLTVGAVQQIVTVVDTPAAVDTSTLQTQGLVTERQVKELPLNGRSFDQLLELNPASVSYTTQRSGRRRHVELVGRQYVFHLRPPAAGQSLSAERDRIHRRVAHQRHSWRDERPAAWRGGRARIQRGQRYLRCQLRQTHRRAEYPSSRHRATTIFTARVYEFFRNSALDARNYFDQAQIPAFQRNDFGVALGGPLRRDKLFAFGNYEGYRQHLGLSDVTFVPDAASRAAAVPSVQPLLALWPVGTVRISARGIAEAYSNPPQHVREDFGTTRIDANLSQNDLLFGVYTIDDSDATTPSANPYSAIYEQPSRAGGQRAGAACLFAAAAQYFRFGYSRASFYFTGIVTGVSTRLGCWRSRRSHRDLGQHGVEWSVADHARWRKHRQQQCDGPQSFYRGRPHLLDPTASHQIEAGVWLQRLQSNDFLAQNQYGQASFSTLATFEQGQVAKYTVVPAPTELGWRSLFGAGFIEDAWKVTPRLEVRAGLRARSPRPAGMRRRTALRTTDSPTA